MGRGGGGGSRGGGGRSGGSRGGSFRSSGGGGRGVSHNSSSSGRGFGSFGGGFRPVRRHYHHGPGYRTTYVRHVSPAESLLTTAFVIFIMLVVFFFAVFRGTFGGDITRSTIEREKLDSQYVTLSDTWYDDSAMGWIDSGKVLEDGLKDFYNETGVQPYLVITDQINGDYHPTGDEVWNYANQLYDELFTDEGHMVFVFQCEDKKTDYMMAACTGVQAKTVLDEGEALEILYDYVDSYFWSDRDDDEMFADAFRDAGKRIMDTQMTTGQTVAIVAGVVVVVVVGYFIVKTLVKRSKEKAEETERILNTPVEKFGDSSLDDLKDKYDGSEGQ